MPLLDLSSNLSIKNKTGFSEDRGAKANSLEVLGESQTLNTNPAKSSPTRRDNREQRDSRDIQRQTSITNRRVADKERQAINIAASRTRAREKEVAKLRESQTTPLINIFNENPLGFIVNQGQNFFQNTNAKGFIEFKQPKETDFIQDNKSINNDTTFQQSQPQQFLDVRGNKTIEFTEKNKAPTTNENSRLLNLHEKDNFLNNYYGQLKGDGQLGIRRQSGPVSLSVLKQPFIVRDIGNEWGIDTFDPSQINGINFGAVGQIVKAGINVLDQLGGAVLGRQPSVFADKGFSELGRLGSLLLSVKGVGFLEKQKILKRLNPQKVITSAKYGLTNDLEKLAIDVKGYDMHPINFNSKSLLSQPGIPSLQFDINRKSPNQLMEILNFDEIAKQYEERFRPPNIREAFKELKQYNVEFDSKLNFTTDGLLEKLTPVADFVAGAAQQAADLAAQGLNYLKGLRGPKINLGLSNPFKTPKFPNLKNPFTVGGTGGGLDLGIPGSLKGVGNFISDTAKAIGSISINRLPLDSSKNLAAEVDLEAFAEIGQDKVNLIPYGTRNVSKDKKVADGRYTGEAVYKSGGVNKTEDELDFCPFRFEDANGNLIVFRAILSGITDQFTPEYSSERYIGRPDNVYVYQGTTREISFTFDVYPKSAEELPILWEKLNYLAGLTYPEWAPAAGGNGIGMVAPFSKLTIGQMYTNTPGYISSLTYTVQDNGTWETMFAKLPKYVQVNCTFVYIGDRLQSSTQKHYELPWVGGESYDIDGKVSNYQSIEKLNKATAMGNLFGQVQDNTKLNKSQINKTLGFG
jgi:hypothetical protein